MQTFCIKKTLARICWLY